MLWGGNCICGMFVHYILADGVGVAVFLAGSIFQHLITQFLQLKLVT